MRCDRATCCNAIILAVGVAASLFFLANIVTFGVLLNRGCVETVCYHVRVVDRDCVLADVNGQYSLCLMGETCPDGTAEPCFVLPVGNSCPRLECDLSFYVFVECVMVVGMMMAVPFVTLTVCRWCRLGTVAP